MNVEHFLQKSTLIVNRFDENKDKQVSAIIFGIPFDSTHSYKPGTRFGPNAIRESFNYIELYVPKFNVDLETANFEDLGNIRHSVVATKMIDMANKITSELIERNKQLIILGGEHIITLGTYPSFPKSTGLIIFDAHYDLHDVYQNTNLNHATWLRRVIESQGVENIIHVGARAFVKKENDFKEQVNLNTISDKDIKDGNGAKLLKDAISVFDKTYISIDLDVMDPAYAPGVGNPEALGISSSELFDMIYSFEDTKVVAADIVEMNPQYDNGSTASVASRLMTAIIAMNVKSG